MSSSGLLLCTTLLTYVWQSNKDQAISAVGAEVSRPPLVSLVGGAHDRLLPVLVVAGGAHHCPLPVLVVVVVVVVVVVGGGVAHDLQPLPVR